MKTESGLRVQEEDLGGPAGTGASSAQSPGLVESIPKPSHSVRGREKSQARGRAGELSNQGHKEAGLGKPSSQEPRQ